jgi:hypothetical protein
MSALAPHTNAPSRHIAIPHLILQSFDDPISTWKTNADNDPDNFLYPWNLVKDQENLVVMLTAKGGHVGWPIGMMPHSWEYMNDLVAAGFVDSFHTSKRRDGKTPPDDNVDATFSNIAANSSNTTRQLLESNAFPTEAIHSVTYGSGN